MKNIFTLLFSLLTFFSYSQKEQPIHNPHKGHSHHGTICKIGEPMPGFVVPARAVSRNQKNPLIFNVTYAPQIPQAARDAFERAGGILSNLFSSTVPIDIVVSTIVVDEDNANTLAFASAGEMRQNFKNAPIPNTNYPIPLAEKLAGEDLSNPGIPDIRVSYNPTVTWNFSSTNVGANQFDFVTVILHEIMHGLGFASTAFFDENENTYTLQSSPTSLPSAYTLSLENRAGENLAASFEDRSNALGIQLRSNNLFLASTANAERARIYAPGVYQPGSSISHLDEATYRNTPNSLMKPSIGRGAVVHDPGDLALNILYDLGWSFTNIIHESTDGGEDVSVPYEILASVDSEQGYDASTVVLHYSQDTFRTETTVDMAATGNPDEFIATIPAPNEFTTYQYYISVNDSRNLQYTSPSKAPVPVFHSYFYQMDNILPEIVHEPVKIAGDADSEIPLDASVTDFFTGVNEVFIEYKINGTTRPAVFMEKDTTDGFRPDLYVGEIPLTRFIEEGDIIEYRIVANDKSDANNTIMSPADGTFHEVEISAIREAVSAYVNDFETDLVDFNGTGFSINNPNGFSDNAIHSIHPYTNAGSNNTRNFNYDLSFPIIIRPTDALIEYDEVVLVEPSTAGTSFGDLEFWDFVIVEGRRIDETEWLPFIDGYDSREHSAWLNAYESGVQGNDSSTPGTSSLFRDRTIDMQANGNFSEGDTVIVRFRLFSDPFAVGWGWAIDNLRIQDSPVSIEEFITPQDFAVYPNPISEGFLNLEARFKQTVNEVTLKLSNIHGKIVKQQNFSIRNQELTTSVDVQNLPKGVYLLTMDLDQKEQITRRIIKQ